MRPLRATIARAVMCTAAFVALLPSRAAADPVELKLAFFASEQSDTFRYGVKPFVDAVNAEGHGVVTIKVYPDGQLGKRIAEQAQMVVNGTADMAWVVPGQTPYRFPDNELLEMPGLFRDVREGTLVYSRLRGRRIARLRAVLRNRRLCHCADRHPQPQADRLACRS